jgi:peptide/nickel transport system substrate-binding protein
MGGMTVRCNRHSRRFLLPVAALATTLVLVAAACGGGGGGGGSGSSSSFEDEGEPQRGGEVVMGLEAETTGGYCLPIAQLAISGIQVANAIYDTLTVPATNGEYVPYLAESVTSNDDFTVWTITLRPNITFHNGQPLDAEALKANLDAWKEGILLSQVFSDAGEITIVDDLTVQVQTTVPWPGFAGVLYLNGRGGIAAPEQIADTTSESCTTQPIGTGPFMCEPGCWEINRQFVATANPDYWATDDAGNKLPYLDQITFVPITEAEQRVNALQQGRIDLMHTSDADATIRLEQLADQGQAKVLIEEPGVREQSYYILNTREAPFNSLKAREAFSLALDRDELIEVTEGGRPEKSTGMFDVDTPGYLEDSGFPEHDAEAAEQLVQEVKDEQGSFDVVLGTTPDPANLSEAELMQQQLEDVGISAEIAQTEQSAFINEVLSGSFSVGLWRNLHSDPAHPDPATTPWFTSENIINFAAYDDPEIDRLLEQGRSASDPDEIERIYSELNRQFSEKLYYYWGWYVDWTIGSKTNVNGVTGPTLPDSSEKWLFLYGRIPTAGLWVS